MIGHYGIAIVEPNNKKFVAHNYVILSWRHLHRSKPHIRPSEPGWIVSPKRAVLFVIGGARHLGGFWLMRPDMPASPRRWCSSSRPPRPRIDQRVGIALEKPMPNSPATPLNPRPCGKPRAGRSRILRRDQPKAPAAGCPVVAIFNCGLCESCFRDRVGRPFSGTRVEENFHAQQN